MIIITQEAKDLYRAEYSAPEAPAECDEDFETEYADIDLTAAFRVKIIIDNQADADEIVSALMRLRTCENCKYGNMCETRDVLLSILKENPKFGCNAWERKA